MTPTFHWLRRLVIVVAALPLFAGALLPSAADAATRLFVAANEFGEIWEIDPATGNKLSGFALIPKVAASRVGLAFDGTYLYYTDENLAVVQVYTTAGVLDRNLPKPAGTEPGAGLGVSTTSLFLVDGGNVITAIDPFTGAVQTSFSVGGAGQALTFAGARNSVFVVVNDSTTINEVSPAGAALFSITVADIFRGLAFSSSSNTLFGVRSGFLWAIDPVTGATLAGYPVQIQDIDSAVVLTKTGAAAADEPVLEFCGDNAVNVTGETCDPPGPIPNSSAICRQDCTYCGDGVPHSGEQCDDGNTVDTDGCRNDCTLPFCGDGVKDPNEACDDGNTTDGDGCSSDCTVEPFCGDGVVDPQLGEQCELPNTPGCDANCHATEICTDLVDNDNDGQIDCLDDDCDCLPIGRDPGAIRFGREGVGDLFAVHGSLKPNTPLNLTTDVIGILLTNANGEIYKLVIPAGDVKQLGRNLFRFRNKLAQRNRDGLARFDLRYYPKRDNFTFVVKTYGDLSKATLADMAVQVVIGDDAFLNESTWARLPKGWLLTLPGE